jgi:rod shape-determining protein MreC
MFDEKKFLQNPKNFYIFLICFSAFFLLVNLFGVKKNIFEVVTFLMNPVQTMALNSSKSVKNFLGVFSEIKTLRTQYYDLQEEYLKLEAESNSLLLLQEESLTLKEQVNLGDYEGELVMAEVLFQDLDLRNESLLINKGEKDGVVLGDVVAVGRMYVGLISDVYEFTSKVRLPTSRASSLKVMILDQKEEIVEGSLKPRNYVAGLAVGYSTTLKIENIETHGGFEEGYPVFLNDQKVGTYLFLGNILSIDADPTLALRTATVRLPVDYTDLKYVFVRKGE